MRWQLAKQKTCGIKDEYCKVFNPHVISGDTCEQTLLTKFYDARTEEKLHNAQVPVNTKHGNIGKS